MVALGEEIREVGDDSVDAQKQLEEMGELKGLAKQEVGSDILLLKSQGQKLCHESLPEAKYEVLVDEGDHLLAAADFCSAERVLAAPNEGIADDLKQDVGVQKEVVSFVLEYLLGERLDGEQELLLVNLGEDVEEVSDVGLLLILELVELEELLAVGDGLLLEDPQVVLQLAHRRNDELDDNVLQVLLEELHVVLLLGKVLEVPNGVDEQELLVLGSEILLDQSDAVLPDLLCEL